MPAQKLNRAIKYRAYPTSEQQVLLSKTFGCKSTNDNGFGMFRTMLEYKLTSQGKTFAKIDKWYPSSKTCSVCGFVKDDLTLADRVWTCSACNTTHNRDHNAAINIRNVGLLGLYPA